MLLEGNVVPVSWLGVHVCVGWRCPPSQKNYCMYIFKIIVFVLPLCVENWLFMMSHFCVLSSVYSTTNHHRAVFPQD